MVRGIFEFTDSTWVEIIWYVPLEGSDLLAVLFREPADGPWQLRSRFRHYVDNDRVWDSDDVKSVYDLKATREDDPAAIKEKFMTATDTATRAFAGDGEVYRLVVRGHAKKAMKMLNRYPFTHKKDITLTKTSVH